LTLLVGAAHGDDHLDGGEGNDELFGDGGADVLFGGAGNDQLTGDSGDGEEFTAFDGDDYLDGEAGDDTLFGQGGNDQLNGGEGNDHLQGGIGNDLLDGGDGEDVLLGGEGNDTLVSDGRDYLDGGAGNDAYEITVQNSGVVAVINDAQGTNTIRLLGAPAGDAAVFAYEGKTFLAAGSAGAVALGDNANFAGLSLMADDGASGRTLQAIINDSSVHGLARSAQWSASGGVRYTRDELFAQNIVGGARGEWLEGGYGSDTISGGAGADRLDGGVGADLLDGGAGADVLNGGTGADTLRGGSGTDTLDGGDDFNRDVYVFARGDGEDRIVRTALPEGAAKDVIRFDAGITAEDVALRNVAQSEQGTPVESLVISYGLGDRITLEQGAQNTIDRLEFADGTSLTITELLSPLAPDAAPQFGTEEGDVLVGTSDGNDYLRGREGNDTLQGEAGDDVLQGDTGHNTYRFTGDSGNDTIFASLGEEGTLVFEGVTPAEVAARIDDGRVVISAGSSTVQVIGLPSIAQASQTWQVQIGSEAPVALEALLPPGELPPVEQADRQGEFLSAQRSQLDELEQRLWYSYGDVNSWLNGVLVDRGGVAPSHVRTAAYQLAAPGVMELPGYLSEVDGTKTITEHYTRPIYRMVFTPDDNSGEGPYFNFSFVHIESLLGIHDLPEGSHLVYGQSFPSDGGGSSHGEQVIGVNIRDTAYGDVDLVAWQ
jgi:Ca2+-binding RTX toxin-like protein